METENSEFHDLLEQDTEIKAPTETVTKMWSFDDEATVISETSNSGSSAVNTGTTEKKPEQPKEVLTDKRKEEIRTASAETAVASIDAMIDLVGGLIISRKCKKQFTNEEFNRAKQIRDIDHNELSEKDKELQLKFIREITLKDRKLRELPFDERDTTRLTAIFYNYFKITGKELSPEFLLYMGIGSILVDKATTIFMD